MSSKDSLDGRPDFTQPPGKPLDPNTIVPEDDAALSEHPGETTGEQANESDQSPGKPDDEHSEGIPASWSEG